MEKLDINIIKVELESCYEALWENLKVLYSLGFPSHKRLYRSKQLQYINDLYESGTIEEFLKDELVDALNKYPTVTLTKIKEKGIEQSINDVKYLNLVIHEVIELTEQIEKDDQDRFIKSLTK